MLEKCAYELKGGQRHIELLPIESIITCPFNTVLQSAKDAEAYAVTRVAAILHVSEVNVVETAEQRTLDS